MNLSGIQKKIIARKKQERLKTLQKNILEGGLMRPKTSESEGHQLELGAVLLESFINMKDEFIILGKVIDWKHFDKKFGESFHERQGRPGLPTRLMVGLTYLKYLHNLSDEKVRKLFLQNPYWQYFCGFICFQKKHH